MTQLARGAAIAVIALGASLPAVALGVVRDPVFTLGKGEGGGTMTLGGQPAILAGAIAPSTFKCNKRNAVIPKAIPVTGGPALSFSYTGKMKGQPGTVVFKGTISADFTKVTGSTKITKGSCTSTLRWTGRPA